MNAGIVKVQSKKHGDVRTIRDMLPKCTIASDVVLRSSLPNIRDMLPKCTIHRI